MKGRLAQPALFAAAAAGLAGVGMRIHNAFAYPISWGFDERFSWRYVIHLAHGGALPHPARDWATADPPLFYAVSGAWVWLLERAGLESLDSLRIGVRLLATAAGLGGVALAALLVRRVDPGDGRRALLAAGLLLFLPAHVYLSAMVNKELLAALLTSLAVYGLVDGARAGGLARAGPLRAAGVGLASGLALLTKLSGAVAVATGAGAFALAALRRGAAGRAAAGVAALLLVASLAGGWYYARNRVLYGYFQPHAMPAHQLMLRMPPGERSLLDYARIPLATFSDPQLLHPDLLRSVWGSTYATAWFDGHRSFLPRESEAVRRLGSVTLVLALLPTAAWIVGSARGLRRALRAPDGPDAPLLLLTVLSLAGYALFTWRNPWFAVLKGSSLLGLSLPFSFYASETLARWTRSRAAGLVWLALAALALCAVLSSTFGLAFEKTELSGLPWQEVER